MLRWFFLRSSLLILCPHLAPFLCAFQPTSVVVCVHVSAALLVSHDDDDDDDGSLRRPRDAVMMFASVSVCVNACAAISCRPTIKYAVKKPRWAFRIRNTRKRTRVDAFTQIPTTQTIRSRLVCVPFRAILLAKQSVGIVFNLYIFHAQLPATAAVWWPEMGREDVIFVCVVITRKVCVAYFRKRIRWWHKRTKSNCT